MNLNICLLDFYLGIIVEYIFGFGYQMALWLLGDRAVSILCFCGVIGMQAPPLHVDVMGDDYEAYQSEHTNSDIAPCE